MNSFKADDKFDNLQFIVKRLNAKPFNLSVRAVEIEQKSSDELLQLLGDIVSLLQNDTKGNVLEEPKDVQVKQITQFLTLHKYKLLPQDESELTKLSDDIANGQECHRILHWMVSNYEYLKTRCYLSQFLMPIEVPLENSDSDLSEMAATYRDLQGEFVETHKEYRRIGASSGPSASELIEAIKQMETEKQQLMERLQREKNHVRGNAKLEHLLKETSRLRIGQEDGIRLQEQKKEQEDLMSSAKRRLEQVRHLSNVIKEVSSTNDSTIEGMDEIINKSITNYEAKMINNSNKLQLKLTQSKETSSTHLNADEVERVAMELEEELDRKLIKFNELSQQSVFRLEKLRTFQQHIEVATTNLQAKHLDIKSKKLEKELIESSLEQFNSNSTLQHDSNKPQRNQLERFCADLISQTSTYEKSKQQLDAMEKRNHELIQKEKRLLDELSAFEASLNEEENKAGVTGFRDVNAELQKTSDETTTLNELKSDTLTEINRTISKIAFMLETKQNELEPKVKELKEKRLELKHFEEAFKREKELYVELMQAAKADNDDYEKESFQLQAEVADKKRTYQELCASNEILQSNINSCISDNLSDLEAAVTEQEWILDGLRKQHDKICDGRQKTMHVDLLKLLELKAKYLGGVEPIST